MKMTRQHRSVHLRLINGPLRNSDAVIHPKLILLLLSLCSFKLSIDLEFINPIIQSSTVHPTISHNKYIFIYLIHSIGIYYHPLSV